MSANDPYEQHRAAFAAELRRVTPKVRTRRRRALALGGASVALACAVTAFVVLAPTTDSRLNVLGEAQAAITASPDSILHFAMTYESTYPLSDADRTTTKECPTQPPELWRATTDGPPRYRLRLPMNPCIVNENAGRIITGALEIAYADRTEKFYAENDGFMLVTTDLPAEADEQLPFIMPGGARMTSGDPKDPVGRIRELLAEGKLTDAGEIQGPRGRTLRRLVGHYTELRGDPKAPKPWPVDVDYRVDAETFAPVTLAVTSKMSVPKDPDRALGPTVHRRITDTARFSTYETIPLTKENEHLLTITPKPGTDVITARDRPATSAQKPSATERARAKKILDAQVNAGIRKRTDW